MNITKISHNPKDLKTVIHWLDSEGNKRTIESRATPRPSFLDALEALVPAVTDACMIHDAPYDSLTVRGVTMKDLDDSDGITITALAGIDWTESPLVLNTPFAPIGLLPTDNLEGLVEKLCDEARLFIRGRRAQQGLFESGEEGGDGQEGSEPEVAGVPASADGSISRHAATLRKMNAEIIRGEG